MAHRKSLTAGRLVMGLLVGVTTTLMLAGTVFLSNEVTNLRADIAELENQKCCLQASNADLQSAWNAATAADVILARAEREGFVIPDEPALVLVCTDVRDEVRSRPWQHLLDHLGGGTEAMATGLPARADDSGLVSLVPRAARDESL